MNRARLLAVGGTVLSAGLLTAAYVARNAVEVAARVDSIGEIKPAPTPVSNLVQPLAGAESPHLGESSTPGETRAVAAGAPGRAAPSSRGGVLTTIDDSAQASRTADPHEAASTREEGPAPDVDGTDALRLAEVALAANASDADALRAAADAAAALGLWGVAAQRLGRLVELDPADAEARFERAAALLRLSRWAQAAAELRVVVELRPSHAQAWYNLAVAGQALGRLSESLRAWDRVLALEPGSADALARRAEVRIDLRDWAGAAADLEAARRLDPAARDVTLNLALVRRRLGDGLAARDLLAALLVREPADAAALRAMAEVTWELYALDPARGSVLRDETIEYCRRLLALIPDDGVTRDRLIAALAER